MTDHHIGNLIVSTPAIRRIVDSFDSRVDVLVDAHLVDLARLLVDAPVFGSRRVRGVRGAAELGRMSARVAGRYAVAIDVATGVRASSIVAATLARHRVGLRDAPRSFLYNRRITIPPAPGSVERHRSDLYGDVLAALGHDGPPWSLARPVATAPAAARAAMSAALERVLPEPAAPFVAIHAGAGKPHRIWPSERFAEIADRMVRRHDRQVCFIGTPADDERTQAAMAAMRESRAACRVELSLLELLALFERADLLVCNESGPMHMAAMTNCPIVALFGPTSPALWAPLREHAVRSLRGEGERTDAIDVDAVWEAVEALAGVPRPARALETCRT